MTGLPLLRALRGASARALVIGAGGLGSPVALYLASAGVEAAGTLVPLLTLGGAATTGTSTYDQCAPLLYMPVAQPENLAYTTQTTLSVDETRDVVIGNQITPVPITLDGERQPYLRGLARWTGIVPLGPEGIDLEATGL